jgi:hypothetical protein
VIATETHESNVVVQFRPNGFEITPLLELNFVAFVHCKFTSWFVDFKGSIHIGQIAAHAAKYWAGIHPVHELYGVAGIFLFCFPLLVVGNHAVLSIGANYESMFGA